MDWQSIESAPKDGTVVLLWGGQPDRSSDELRDDADYLEREWPSPRPVTAWWKPARYHGAAPDAGHWRYRSYDSGVYGEYDSPTHWMPAPPAPSAS